MRAYLLFWRMSQQHCEPGRRVLSRAVFIVTAPGASRGRCERRSLGPPALLSRTALARRPRTRLARSLLLPCARFFNLAKCCSRVASSLSSSCLVSGFEVLSLSARLSQRLMFERGSHKRIEISFYASARSTASSTRSPRSLEEAFMVLTLTRTAQFTSCSGRQQTAARVPCRGKRMAAQSIIYRAARKLDRRRSGERKADGWGL